MKKISVIFGGVTTIALAAISAGTAIAGTTTTNTVSSAPSASAGQSVQKAPSSLMSHLTSTYVAVFTGGSLSDPTGPYSPTVHGTPDMKSPQQIENLLGLYYKLSPTMKVGPILHFFYRPVLGQDIRNADPLLNLSNSEIINSGQFKMAGYARAYLPLTADSTNINRSLQLRFFVSPSYEIRNSRWTVGAYAYMQPAFYNGPGKLNSEGAVVANTTLLTYLGPNVSFQATPTLAITGLYEMAASHHHGQVDTMDLNNEGTDFEPGLAWDVTPNVSVNPYLNIYTGNKITIDNTSINLLVVAKLL